MILGSFILPLPFWSGEAAFCVTAMGARGQSGIASFLQAKTNDAKTMWAATEEHIFILSIQA